MNELLQLQSDVAGKLGAEPELAKIPVDAYIELAPGQEASILENFRRARAGFVGVGVQVMLPSFAADEPNNRAPSGIATVTVKVREQTGLSTDPATGLNTLAGGWMSAESVALIVAQVLHQWVWGDQTFWVEGITPDYSDKSLRAYNVPAKTMFNLAFGERTGRPVITGTLADVTLSNTDSGASIYYTTDGSFPVAGNAAASLYSAPFAVAAGTMVRAAAYKTGKQGSDISLQYY